MKSIHFLKKIVPPAIRKKLKKVLHIPDSFQAYTSAHTHQIFDEIQTIFVHVPRTAGVSIETTLAKFTAKRPIGGHQTSVDYQFIYPSHWESYFTFGFVRNPWDRLVSAFFYLQDAHRDNPFVQRYILPYQNNLNTFITDIIGPNPSYLYCIAHLKPQAYFLNLPNGHTTVDFIGRYEYLEQDWPIVCNRIGIQEPLPHQNKSVHRLQKYQDHYTPETVAIVSQLYKRDIVQFGYSYSA